MTPAERRLLQNLDRSVLDASSEELRKIQEMDRQTQLDGMSFCDTYINSRLSVNNTIKQEQRKRKA